MSWQTNTVVIGLRGVARKLGLNHLIQTAINKRGYEQFFHKRMIDTIRPGDTIWDVGANIGYYSNEFARIAGAEAVVYAFEPSPHTVQQLRGNVDGNAQIKVMNLALGAASGTAMMQQSEDSEGANSRILEGGEGIPIEVARGDDLVARGDATVPNFMKIDVEGFELDVLNGMGGLLANPALRSICIEVHFRLLALRGMTQAPIAIEKKLRDAGFTVEWADASHLIAQRK